VYYMITVISK